jgi:hypothetical protein
MARGTTTHSTRTSLSHTDVSDLTIQFNKLVADLENPTKAYGNPALAIVSNFDVKNTAAIMFTIAGTMYTLAVNQTCDTGTSKVITADMWSSMLVSVNSSAALTGTWAASSYATEALAIAALAAVPTDQVPIGYVTVLTGSGVTWTAGTDALETGTGGTASADTNYYNIAPAVLTAAKIGNLAGTVITS